MAELRAPGKWVLRPERLKDLEAVVEMPHGPPAAAPVAEPLPSDGEAGSKEAAGAATATRSAKRRAGWKRAAEGEPVDAPVTEGGSRGAPVTAPPAGAQKRRKGAHTAAPAAQSAQQAGRAAPQEAEPQVLNRKQVQQEPPASEPPPSALLSANHWAPLQPTAFDSQALYSWQKAAPPEQLPPSAVGYGGGAVPASDSRRLGTSNASSTVAAGLPSVGGLARLQPSQTLATSLGTSAEATPGGVSGPRGTTAAGPCPKPSVVCSLRALSCGGGVGTGSTGGAAGGCGGLRNGVRASRLGSGDSTGSLRRSLSGARFHEHYDESWFAEHVARPPALHCPITSDAEVLPCLEVSRFGIPNPLESSHLRRSSPLQTVVASYCCRRPHFILKKAGSAFSVPAEPLRLAPCGCPHDTRSVFVGSTSMACALQLDVRCGQR